MSDRMEGLEEISDAEIRKENEELQEDAPALSSWVQERFFLAETARVKTEARWLQSYNDFRGIYPGGITFRETEKSRVFVKIAKTKTLAAYGQLIEVLFSGNKFPIGISATKKPVGIAKRAHLSKEDEDDEIDPMFDVGYSGDGRKSALDTVIGGLKSVFKGANFSSGVSRDPGTPDISPADIAAQNMEDTIHDQLNQTHAARELRSAVFEAALYGTGIIKGPYSEEKTLHKWDLEGEGEDLAKTYTPIKVLAPRIEHVSVWNFYPDPSATSIEGCEYAIERHKFNRSEMRNLAKRPHFNVEAISMCLEMGTNYTGRGHEDNLGDDAHDYSEQNRWEILEYWGVLDAELAIEAGLDIDLSSVTAMDEVNVNVWICNDVVLRAVVNPFEPERLPYNAFVYETNPHELFGVGVPENMADSTQIMNGHMRMAIDNLAISGHVILDIDESALVSGQSKEMFPGKIFERQAGSQGQSIYAIKIPNTTRENMEMFDKTRQLADEQTGIPSYSHGQTGIQSTTRTAAGMSMLMGAASLATKTVVKNLDDYLLKPLGESYFYWNMQFNKDLTIYGDLEVKALGTDAIMQKEVRSQRLIQFLQVASNPLSAPFLNIQYVMKEIAKALELDPEESVNDMEQAQLFAEIMKKTGGMPPAPPSGVGAPPPVSSNGLGDGGIGAGNAAMPGEDTFSGAGKQGE